MRYRDVVPLLNHSSVRDAARPIAGRFKAARVEIGSVTGSLRDMLLKELEMALESWGTPFRFPPASQLTNNKDASSRPWLPSTSATRTMASCSSWTSCWTTCALAASRS